MARKRWGEGVHITDFTSPQEIRVDSKGKIIGNIFSLNRILDFINQGFSQKQIQETINIPRKNLEYRLKKLESADLIRKIPGTKPLFFELTGSGKQAIENKGKNLSLGMRTPLVKIHNFSVEMPLIRDLSTDFWEKSWELNNWIKSFRDMEGLGVSVERTPKTVTVNFKPQEVREENITPLIFNGIFSIVGFLKGKGIEVEPWGMKVSRQEYASDQPLVKPLTDRGVTYRQPLGRPVARIFANDSPKEAAAWIDHSQGRPEVDTNDMTYARDVIQMPQRIEQIEEITRGSMSTLHSLANTQTYMAATIKILALEVSKIRKKVRGLDQRSVRDFV